MDAPAGLLTFTGRIFLHFLTYLGQLSALMRELIIALRSGVWRLKLVAQQVVAIGYGSQAVVIVTGAFTGAVFTFQSYGKFKDFGMETSVGAVVSVALCRELGPVLAGLMVAGRVGAAMAADIGTMKVTEQVDALRVMGVHPVDYLVLPRFLAMMISMPFLVAESVSFGLIASYMVMSLGYDMPSAWYLTHLVDHTNMDDLKIGMIKGFIFGMLITLIACHQGLAAENGAVGVGAGTTRAVVISSLVLLIVNFFLSIALNYIYPIGTV
ncbi:MlaE family ABC transporter permease [Prosthecobacter sp.]|jgi:phospholipid/cholesterol/gamma-HCH transport system permease protein|uniref:MlaE family ABC transporter permease n=1 Tax=Prosthecobacter sp. TaxID=1965333 RepID=UPI003784FACF